MDFLTKKMKTNEGEVPQYYVENSHPAIIEPDVFDMVQLEIKRRKERGGHHSGAGCFSSKIVCGECGNFYGSKVWHSTSKYRRTIWQCNHKFKGSDKCGTPHIDETNLIRLFLDLFNQLINGRDEILENCKSIKQMLTDTVALDTEAEELQRELDIVTELIGHCVDENARIGLDQAAKPVLRVFLLMAFKSTAILKIASMYSFETTTFLTNSWNNLFKDSGFFLFQEVFLPNRYAVTVSSEIMLASTLTRHS